MNNKTLQQALKLFFALVLITGLLVPVTPTSALPQKNAPLAVQSATSTIEIVIKYWPDHVPADPSGTEQMGRINTAAGVGASLTYGREMPGNTHILQFPSSVSMAVAWGYSKSLMENLIDAEDNKELIYAAPWPKPNDNYYAADQWNFHGDWGINVPAAWSLTAGSEDIVVAVLDTGIVSHDEDLTSSRIINNPGGYDFVTDVAGDATDQGIYTGCPNTAWRGTHVAGIIGAASNNTTGVAGINWNARILPVRVSGGTCGVTAAADIVQGMSWAAGLATAPDNENPADVIHVSASVAGQACTTDYQTVVNNILAKNIVIVAAAGDTATNAVGFPANCNGVITVAATDALGNWSTFSNYGAAVEISAPGGGNGQPDVLSTSDIGETQPLGATYQGKMGTAMAAAHVSGVVSLMFAANPGITPAQVSAILQKTVKAFPGGSTCSTSICGWGIVDAGEAIRYANMPDLIISNVTLSNNLPLLTDTFEVNVTVKNQGGLNLEELNANSITTRQIYVDRDPSLITRDINGCIYLPDGSGDIDTGEFFRMDLNSPVASGTEATFPVIINNPNPPPANSWTDPLSSGYYDGSIESPLPWGDGAHKLYVYTDANCTVKESFDDNNSYSTYIWVNPFIEGALLYPRQGQNIGLNSNPTYKWNRVADATRYRLYLGGPSGTLTDQWFEASSVCDLITPTCSVELGPNLVLGNATYTWYLQSYVPPASYIWSNNAQPTNFSTIPPVPTAAVNLLPNSYIGENYTPNYTWDKVTTATYYHLYVSGPGGFVLDQWYQASNICTDTTCSVTSPLLGGGAYSWFVQTYSPGGFGPWSNNAQPTIFSTSTSLPGATANLSPNSYIGTNYTPTYTWDKVTGATYYRVYVSGPTGLALDQWYQASSVCNDTTCSVVSPLLGGGTHSWLVQTYSPAGVGPWSNNGQATIFSTSTSLPGAATNLSPNSYIGTNYTPTYIWNKATGATYYHLYVSGPAGLVLDQWYQASSICNDTTCSVLSPLLGGGTHSWFVQTYGPAGYGPWSNNAQPTIFSTSTNPPAAAANLSPNSYIGTDYTPTYIWDKVAGATYYRLYVSGPAGLALDQWYQASSICNDTTCSVVSPSLIGGTYGWLVQTYSPIGMGPWSNNAQPTIFSISTTPPDAAANLSPNSYIGGDYTPTYTWDKVAGATYYRLYVSGPAGLALDQWYQASSICDDTTCSVVSPSLIGGTYGWLVLTYSPAGYGPWSNGGQPIYFSTATIAPDATVLTDPVNGQNLGKEYNPIYRWSKVDGATYYRIVVVGPNGAAVLDQWFKAADVCDLAGCSTVSPTLNGGAYSWYVQTYGPGGMGPWSNSGQPTAFNADIPTAPRAGTNLTPTGTTANHTPTYSWTKVSMAFWYHLYIKGPNGLVLDKWYQGKDVCVGDTCSVVSPALVTGDHTWWVQAWNVAGYGPWKSSAFKVYP